MGKAERKKQKKEIGTRSVYAFFFLSKRRRDSILAGQWNRKRSLTSILACENGALLSGRRKTWCSWGKKLPIRWTEPDRNLEVPLSLDRIEEAKDQGALRNVWHCGAYRYDPRLSVRRFQAKRQQRLSYPCETEQLETMDAAAVFIFIFCSCLTEFFSVFFHRRDAVLVFNYCGMFQKATPK